MNNLKLLSELTCPHCQFKVTLIMPTDACQWFYEYTQSHKLLEPLKGDCCVFCSYASIPCPSIQIGNSCYE